MSTLRNSFSSDQVSTLDAVIRARQSIRAFQATPVPAEVLKEILQLAARAPSGTNTQPWRTYIVQGSSQATLVAKVCAAHDALRQDPSLAQQFTEPYDYYPEKWVSPFIDRRRENGWGLYGLLGIGKGDKDKMHAQHQRNYRFFDAPVGMFFTLDKIMGRGSLVDYGMFLQNLMLAAQVRGLATCPQAAWNAYSSIILPHLGAEANEMLVCGLSIGYADQAAVVNSYYTPRVEAESFTTWLD